MALPSMPSIAIYIYDVVLSLALVLLFGCLLFMLIVHYLLWLYCMSVLFLSRGRDKTFFFKLKAIWYGVDSGKPLRIVFRLPTVSWVVGRGSWAVLELHLRSLSKFLFFILVNLYAQ